MAMMDPPLNHREEILATFEPFVHPHEIDGIVIGNDLDSLLSACLLKEIFGWDVVGIYDYSTIWYSASETDFSYR